jgi:FkbM family methyltransferase
MAKSIIGILREEGTEALFWRSLKTVVGWKLPYLRSLPYSLLKVFKNSTVMEVNGVKMHINMRDTGLSQALYLYHTHEPVSTEYFRKTLKPGMTVLDIGANIGYFALLEAKIVGRKGKVYAVEPVSENISFLERNAALNNFSNIEVFRFAIGDKTKLTKIHVMKKRNYSSMWNVDRGSKRISSEDVQETTVDAFLKNKSMPDVVRMDVEGYEYNILKGMWNTLKKDIMILMELHAPFLSKAKLTEMFSTLKKNGFGIGWCVLDPPDIILNSKGRPFSLYPIIKKARQKLGETQYGKMDVDMDKLLEWSLTNRENPHVLFKKIAS